MKARISRIRFAARMAWRDSRASRRRLLLFTLCISIGISALVAVGSFGRSLERGVERQAKSMLGADLVIGSRVRFTRDHEAFLQMVGGEQAREISFSTMIVFPNSGDTRLVQVRAIDDSFPFYGRIETIPDDGDSRFRRTGGVLVEEPLLLQFDAKVGDVIRIGNLTTRVTGALRKVPGESVAFATLAPRLYLRMADLDATGLLKTGSLARYRVLFLFPDGTNVEELVRKYRPQIDNLRLSVTTVEERKEDLGQAMRNLYHFLNLVAFVALLLGGVGVASAIQSHVKQKLPTVAVLRCLGTPIWTAFWIYLLQGIALGVLGAGLGTIAGVLVQRSLPWIVSDFIPFEIQVQTSWVAVGQAALFGFLICFLFALLPLTAVRRVSPLAALRSAYEGERRRDPLQLLVALVLGLAVLVFALASTERWQEGLGFAGGLLAAFLGLAGMARLAIALARRLRLARWPFVFRQGLANVHRPNNRTLLLVMSLGLGTFLLVTLRMVETTLLRELISGRESGRANAILFDIQPDQKADLENWVRSLGLPVLDEAPIVTMRLKAVKGRSVETILAEMDNESPRWILRREFRSTFTDHLRDSEKIVAGTWTGKVEANQEPVPVSVEEGIARELGVTLGDEIDWDIQGVPLRTTVGSIREVDWRRVQPNFFVLFPRGALEDAPAFHVLVSRVNSPAESARLQRSVVQKFPNVSIIDITVVLRTLDQILSRIAFAIQFMALFTVATGLLVLVAAVLSGRYQRMREGILLRVLGASRRQILRMLLVEYAALGLLAAATGVVLAIAASAALSWFVFRLPFSFSLGPPLSALVIVTFLTVLTGFLAGRGTTTHPPLEILRQEA